MSRFNYVCENGIGYAFSDTRASKGMDGVYFKFYDGYEKTRKYGNKTVSIGGYTEYADKIFSQITDSSSISDIQNIARKACKDVDIEMGVSVFLYRQGEYIMYDMTTHSHEPFEIFKTVLDKRAVLCAGAGTNEAEKLIQKFVSQGYSIFDSVVKSFMTLNDEVVGGQLIYYVNNKGTITKHVLDIPNVKKDLRHWNDRHSLHAMMDGRARFADVKLTKPDGRFLADTNNGVFDLDGWDLKGVGKLTAEMIAVNTITADDGYINNLTVNHLKTIGRDVEVGQYVDYIDIKDNSIQFITAKVGSKVQATDSKGRPLFWTDNTKTILSPEETQDIAWSYSFDEVKVKSTYKFINSGSEAYPVIDLGEGDNKGYGKASIEKPVGSLEVSYKASNTGKDRSLILRDDGLIVNAETGAVIIQAKELTIRTEAGGIIEMPSNGGINFNSKVGMNFNAPRYDFH
ncbi:hypothetical protein [Paenibacillus polymyxa]|uniref:hypothetical protein n=1 Tax=Paenibacillus polymyxa TaxID=1406 RepID=UPI0020258537|nr:hypothetical protein [Paenibacillus polymyxa]MDU8675357.1 hypothetical protein [Paenibacillus polymyxa]MDU8700264.1 hypothetical protein [Paenibacillus polymyxa]URJ66724.1 hypothetical protein MF620_001626 [Paenibacillus polymyxa]URJ69394.1 hypothetical protein MF624_004261 [Paenibacillus polymyxa]WEC94825.1 hypothetical protein MF623_08340 [Paenibacillus polymyxa]